MARWLGQQGYYFCSRQKKSTYVLVEDKPGLKLAQLGLSLGTRCFYNAVTMTRSKGFDQAHLAGKWKRRYRGFVPEESWFLLTNLDGLDEAVAAYQKRFDIEESFLNDKSNGFELERSAIRDAQMLEKLCFVLAVATLYLTAQGLAVVEAGDRQRVDTHWLRGNSFLRIG